MTLGSKRLGLLMMALVFGLVILIARHAPTPQPLSFPASDYDPTGFPASGSSLIGTNYTHFSFADCDGDSKAILREYHRPQVVRAVHSQLQVMRENGIDALRILIWHMTDIPRQPWGPVPSRGGRLREPYRGNFVNFLGEVRRFGFSRLTLSFAPLQSNSPRDPNFDPKRFEENWDFIQDIRTLAKTYGPTDTRFDLLNEGGPSDHSSPVIKEQLAGYVTRMYSRYVSIFGKNDVVVSVIAPRSGRDRGNRLQNLIDIFSGSGYGQPKWFEIHLNFPPDQVLYGLLRVDEVLTEHHLTQPIVIGETAYNDPEVAQAIEMFAQGSNRRLDEITQWVKRPVQQCNVSPPYSASEYLELRTRHDIPTPDSLLQ